MEKIKFLLAGCDISFVAEAPADMTVKQLLDQASKIKPDWCDCGVHYLHKMMKDFPPEISFDYDSVKKINEDVDCTINTKVEDCYYVLD